MPTHGYQGNCSSEVIGVSIMLYSEISSNMANYSARVTVVGSCYAFRIKCMCNGTFGTSHVCYMYLQNIYTFVCRCIDSTYTANSSSFVS